MSVFTPMRPILPVHIRDERLIVLYLKFEVAQMLRKTELLTFEDRIRIIVPKELPEFRS